MFILEKYPAHCNTEYHKQGYWGEMYIKDFLERAGWLVYMNPDQYGGWDMIKVDKTTGKSSTIQVKTLVRYVTRGYFGIKDGVMGQTIKNLKSCDELILVVRNPNSIDDREYKGKVLKVKNHKNFTLNGKEYIIPSEAENFVHLSTLSYDELQQVNSHKTYRN